jgi:hypothetical protein
MLNTRFAKLGLAALLCTGLVACQSTGGSNMPMAKSGTPGDTIGLTDSGWLVTFNRAMPANIATSMAVTGLPAGEKLVGVDYRPANGWLYALSQTGTLYTIDTTTGAAKAGLKLMAAPDQKRPYTALMGTRFTVDFNPVADRLRVISDRGQSLRINVDTGATITDGDINGGAATTRITDGAYTNSMMGATATQLWVIDGANSMIYLQNPPNDGVLSMGKQLGVTVASTHGFNIDAATGIGYAALAVDGKAGLYSIDPKATPVAKLVGGWTGPAVIDIAFK